MESNNPGDLDLIGLDWDPTWWDDLESLVPVVTDGALVTCTSARTYHEFSTGIPPRRDLDGLSINIEPGVPSPDLLAAPSPISSPAEQLCSGMQPASGARENKAKTRGPSAVSWRLQKPNIRNLYIEDDRTLKETRGRDAEKAQL